MTLNRSPTNYFEEVESIAFSSGSLIPGIEASENKLLQGRLFSYFDTQRHRLGGNFQQITVNKPKNEVINYNSDGVSSSRNNTFENPDINYQPSHKATAKEDNSYKLHNTNYSNIQIVQEKIDRTNDFSQAGDFYRALSKEEKAQLISNLLGDLHQVRDQEIQKIMVKYFYQADSEYGTALAKGLSLDMNYLKQ